MLDFAKKREIIEHWLYPSQLTEEQVQAWIDRVENSFDSEVENLDSLIQEVYRAKEKVKEKAYKVDWLETDIELFLEVRKNLEEYPRMFGILEEYLQKAKEVKNLGDHPEIQWSRKMNFVSFSKDREIESLKEFLAYTLKLLEKLDCPPSGSYYKFSCSLRNRFQQ